MSEEIEAFGFARSLSKRGLTGTKTEKSLRIFRNGSQKSLRFFRNGSQKSLRIFRKAPKPSCPIPIIMERQNSSSSRIPTLA